MKTIFALPEDYDKARTELAKFHKHYPDIQLELKLLLNITDTNGVDILYFYDNGNNTPNYLRHLVFTRRHKCIQDFTYFIPFEGHKFVCVHCESIMQSQYEGHFCECKCGKSFIDETKYYCRSGGEMQSLTRLLVEDFTILLSEDE